MYISNGITEGTMKKYIIFLLITLLLSSKLLALPMSGRRIKIAKRIAMRILSEIVTNKTKVLGDTTTISLTNKDIGHMHISDGQVVIQNLTKITRNKIANRNIGFNKLAEKVKIKASGVFLQNDIQEFIDYKIKKLRFRYKVFPKAKINIQNNVIEAKGTVILKKIPGMFMGFATQKAAPFKVRFSILSKEGKINLDIIDGIVNGQPITADLKASVLSWLNPIWDFNKSGFKANIESLVIDNGKISTSINLF